MTITEFVSFIAGAINRSIPSLTANGLNQIVVAANNAKRNAEKVLDFERLKDTADIVVSLTSGGDLDTATVSGSTIRINRLKKAYIQFAGDYRPADIVTRDEMYRRYKLRWDEITPWDRWTSSVATFLPATPMIYRIGKKIYIWPGNVGGLTSPNTNVRLDVVKWSDDYTYNKRIRVTINVISDNTIDDSEPFYDLTCSGTINGAEAYTDFAYINEEIGSSFPGEPQLLMVAFNALQNKYEFIASGINTTGPFPIIKHMYSLTTGVNGLLGVYKTKVDPLDGQITVTAPLGAVTNVDDFFLDECLDWMTLKVMKHMNIFLKDDKRVSVSQREIDEAWQGVVSWNNSLGDNSDSQGVTLD